MPLPSWTVPHPNINATDAKLASQIQPAQQLDNALELLDALLASAVEHTRREFTPQGALDSLRGLHISDEDVRRALQPAAINGTSHNGTSQLSVDEIAAVIFEHDVFANIARIHALDNFELVTLLIALAPEIDLRYQRVYAYLQDDVTKKRPTVDLVLTLLCSTREERIARRESFAVNGALVRNQVIELVCDPNYVAPPLIAQYVKPDEQIVRLLLGDHGMDSRLGAVCQCATPQFQLIDLPLNDSTTTELASSAKVIAEGATTTCLWLCGPDTKQRAAASNALAGECGLTLLTLDIARVAPTDIEATLRQAMRAAALGVHLLYVELDESTISDSLIIERLASITRDRRCAVVFGAASAIPTTLLGIARPIALPLPERMQRETYWRRELLTRGIPHEEKTIEKLASRFSLSASQISSAVADACIRTAVAPTCLELHNAARAQSGQSLARIADRIVPRATWEDIVLPADALHQLREICQRVEFRDHVFDNWGFGPKSTRGRGTTALFSGGSGTGKTMAAEVIANALGLDLYRIDLARVVSKYIGETEKNFQQVFAAAEGANAILLFDEADALFGKRSEVKDAHDRYANIEISYLLQKMEEYSGVAILATNLADNLDTAFARRLAFALHFPFPDEADRRVIWARVWPHQTPLAPNIDRSALARQFRLSGGNIRNVALAAAFLAAEDGGIVAMEHVHRAIERESQKLRKPVSALGPSSSPSSSFSVRGA